MQQNMYMENMSVKDKKPRALYIIQGLLMFVSMFVLISSINDLNENSDIFMPLMMSYLSGILFSILLSIGFFSAKDKFIKGVWIASAVVGFASDIFIIIANETPFLLLVSAVFIASKIFLACGFTENKESKLKILIVIAPILLLVYIILTGINAGINSVEYMDTYYEYNIYYHRPDETEIFFDSFIESFITSLIGNLISFLFAYLILIAKLRRMKFIKNASLQDAYAAQQAENFVPEKIEVSVAEKAEILKEYKAMLDEGIITKEEYEEKKNSILNS